METVDVGSEIISSLKPNKKYTIEQIHTICDNESTLDLACDLVVMVHYGKLTQEWDGVQYVYHREMTIEEQSDWLFS